MLPCSRSGGACATHPVAPWRCRLAPRRPHFSPHSAPARAALLVVAAAAPPLQGPGRGYVLVAPAYLSGSRSFVPFVEKLRGLGYNAALPPIRWHDWLPTLGGRSVRPILDRLDFALTQLVEGYQVDASNGYEIPLPRPPTREEKRREYADASGGALPALPHTGPWSGPSKAALVACSASGWIARILLADQPPYCGQSYCGADRVHTLVTLGSPHFSYEAVTRRNIELVNTCYPGAYMPGVRYVVVGSSAVRGWSVAGGLLQDFAYSSYSFCCGKGDVWGDGVTPLENALALDGAEHVALEGAFHMPADEARGKQWYGSDGFLPKWEPWLVPPDKGVKAGAGAGAEVARAEEPVPAGVDVEPGGRGEGAG